MPKMIEIIEADHHEIEMTLATIKNNIALDLEPSMLISQLSGLLTIINRHFRHEEALMRDSNYFDYEAHMDNHRVFSSMAVTLYNTTLEDTSYIPDVLRLITNWLSTHIEVEMFLLRAHQRRITPESGEDDKRCVTT